MSGSALVLWQAEWCPSSHRVRQRLTELGLTFTARQVPADRDARQELLAVTGSSSIPVLVHGAAILVGEERILAYLDTHFSEPPGAVAHRAKAA